MAVISCHNKGHAAPHVLWNATTNDTHCQSMVLSIVYHNFLAILRYRISVTSSNDKYQARECIYGPHCAWHRSCRPTKMHQGITHTASLVHPELPSCSRQGHTLYWSPRPYLAFLTIKWALMQAVSMTTAGIWILALRQGDPAKWLRADANVMRNQTAIDVWYVMQCQRVDMMSCSNANIFLPCTALWAEHQ